jgi:sulfatase maturation enzyme AslB (radical SAM superfamily)
LNQIDEIEQQGNIDIKELNNLIFGTYQKYKYVFNYEKSLLFRITKPLDYYFDKYPFLFITSADLDPDEQVARIQFFPTLACNMRCKYCYNASGEYLNAPVISSKIIKSGIDYVLRNGAKYLLVHFIGGEPTLAINSLRYAVDYANNAAPYTDFYIVTNGTFGDEVFKLLVEHDFDVIVSLDSVNKVNDQYRLFASGSSPYNVVLKNIKRLSEENIRLLIRSTLTKESVDYISEFLIEMNNCGVKKIRFEPMLNTAGRAIKNALDNKISSLRLFKELYKALTEADKMGISIDMPLSKYIRLRDKRFKRPLIVLPNGHITNSAVVCHPKQEEYDQFHIMSILPQSVTSFPEKIKLLAENFKYNTNTFCSDCPIVSMCLGRLRGYDFSRNELCINDNEICNLYCKMHSILMHFWTKKYKKTKVDSDLTFWEII